MSHIFYKEIIFNENMKHEDTKLIYKVFLHEIGHCTYHLSHTNKDYKEIMNAVTNSYKDEIWSDLLYEYFNKEGNNKKK
jgi:hypothetical protein